MKTIKITELENMSIDEALKLVEWNYNVNIENCIALARSIAQNIIAEDNDGLYSVNKNNQLILTDVAFVSLYTNIEVDNNDYYNFNIINKQHLINKNSYEYILFKEIMENEVQEYLDKNTFEHIVARVSNNITDKVCLTLEHMNSMIDKGDPNKIAKYLSKGLEAIANKMPDFTNLDQVENVKHHLKGLK